MYRWKESMQLGGSEEVSKIMTYPDLLATLCPVILMALCWSCQEEYTNQSLALRGVITPETPSHTEQCKESSHTHTAKVKNKTSHTYTHLHSFSKGWERDNRETTAVSYRKWIRTWAGERRAEERSRGSTGITSWTAEWVEGRFHPVNCPNL